MYLLRAAALLLAGATSIAAIPLEDSKRALHQLVSRHLTYDRSCDAMIPNNSGLRYKDRLEKAFNDVGELTRVALDETAVGKKFEESSAFSHYFSAEEGPTTRRMMEVISQYRQRLEDGWNRAYRIDISCGSAQSAECKRSVLAATDARPDETSVVFCDRFFSSDLKATNRDLETKKFTSRRGGWCQKGEDLAFFSIGALTVFHELTHLHDVGQHAELPARPDPEGFDSAGTVDVYVMGGEDDIDHYSGMEPWQAARELRRLWNTYNTDNSAYKPTTPAIENAESYAAAALEFYILHKCGWGSIPAE